MNCLDFFSEHGNDDDFCKELQGLPEEVLVQWEDATASPLSPGVVQNAEILCRRVLSPLHYDSASQKLKPTAFDDASSKGLSVNRLSYTNMGEITLAAAQRASTGQSTNSFWGYANFRCGEARDMRSEFGDERDLMRLFAVYDTALPGDVSHADVCQIVPGRAFGRSVRSKLAEIASKKLHKF